MAAAPFAEHPAHSRHVLGRPSAREPRGGKFGIARRRDGRAEWHRREGALSRHELHIERMAEMRAVVQRTVGLVAARARAEIRAGREIAVHARGTAEAQRHRAVRALVDRRAFGARAANLVLNPEARDLPARYARRRRHDEITL